MPTRIRIRLTLLGLLMASLLPILGAACGGDSGGNSNATPKVDAKAEFGLQIQDVASVDHPSALAFLPDGRLLIAEQFTGDILVVGADGKLADEPFAHIDVADWLHLEWGLTGLAVDPDFASNHYIYAFYTAPQPSDAARPIGQPKLVRFTENNGFGADETTLISDFPQTQLDHQGFKANGSLHFGPDGFLYLTVGDYDYGKNHDSNGLPYAQDLASPLGKVLRVDASTGDAAPGNPFENDPGADQRVFAYGFNLARDFAFHPQTTKMYGNDATDSCEELDVIESGKNYGWPEVGEFPFPNCTEGTQVPGIYFLSVPDQKPGYFLSPVRVSGMAFVSGQRYAALGDGLLVCEANTSLMKRLVLTAPGFDTATAEDTVVNDCNRGVTTSVDGTIYYGTDSQVKRLTPATP